MENYSVLIAKTELPDKKRLAGALEEFYKITEERALQMAANSWGFAGESLARDKAELLSEKCKEYKIDTLAINTKDTFLLPPGKIFTKGALKPEGLNYTLETGESGFMAWERISLIAAAPVKEEKIKILTIGQPFSAVKKLSSMAITLTTGIPISLGGKKQETKQITEVELIFYLDIFCSVSPGRLRMRADHFDFSCLGKKKEFSSTLNFRNLLEELSIRTTKSLRNKGMQSILSQEPLYGLGYSSVSALEKECIWLLTVSK